MKLVNQNPRAFSVGPHLRLEPEVSLGNAARSQNAALQCQERIQCLEKALGFMQVELNRLQTDHNHIYKSNDCLHLKPVAVATATPPPARKRSLQNNNSNNKKIQYEQIQVWPSSPSVLLEDFGCRVPSGYRNVNINVNKQTPTLVTGPDVKCAPSVPKPLPRTASIRARSVAPVKFTNQSFFSDAFRATSEPPKRPFFFQR